MLKQTIFWTGLIAVLIGVVVTLVKHHRRGRRRQDLPLDAGVRPAPDSRQANGATRGTPRLMCLNGINHGHRFEIPPRGLSIGRARDNDLVIVDGRVSAHHAWIGIVNDRTMLRDYQSLNGTFLNADMSSPVSEVALADGDTIFFGGHGHQYRLVVE